MAASRANSSCTSTLMHKVDASLRAHNIAVAASQDDPEVQLSGRFSASSCSGGCPLVSSEAEIPAATSTPQGLTSNSCRLPLLIRAPGSRLDIPLLQQLPAMNTYPYLSACSVRSVSLFPFVQSSDISAFCRDKYQTVESLGLPRNASRHSTNRAAIFLFLPLV